MKTQQKNRILLAVLTAVLTLLVPNLSSAESLLMTGTMFAQQTAEGTLHWILGGGDIAGSGGNTAIVNFGAPGGQPYSFSVDTFNRVTERIDFRAGGTSYMWGSVAPALLQCACTFVMTVAGEPILLPERTTDFSILNLSTPVSMSGQLQLCSSPGVCQVDTQVHGQGIVNMSFIGTLGGRWHLERGDVILTEPPLEGGAGAPVPEPATLLLFGSGLAGLAAKRRMRCT